MEPIKLLPHPGLDCGRFTHIMNVYASALPLCYTPRSDNGHCRQPYTRIDCLGFDGLDIFLHEDQPSIYTQDLYTSVTFNVEPKNCDKIYF